MHYVYMNNFRGFSDSLVPLYQVNFLVGENSTGKSSFLSALSLVNQPIFWFNPTFATQDDIGLSSFKDIISAWSHDKSSFEIGAVITKKEKDKVLLSFSIQEFINQDDTPKLIRHSKLAGKRFVSIIFEKSRARHKSLKIENDFRTDEQAISEFKNIIASTGSDFQGYELFPKDIPSNSPIPLYFSLIKDTNSNRSIPHEIAFELPMGMPVTWIAPIRSKPKRIYDGTATAYSPEGDHVPQLLRKTLRSKTASRKFADRLKEFGESSGLFETVIAHSFGRGNQNPFELLIRFKGAELNINNVGYGVSQALPLIVEFLTTERRKVFEVQQPEVHLHPRAQAALGGLIFELARDKKHSFFIETHSDYLIDRFRLSQKNENTPLRSQMLFFTRTSNGNRVHSLPISNKGQYPSDQPKEFRDFFIKEEMKLLDL